MTQHPTDEELEAMALTDSKNGDQTMPNRIHFKETGHWIEPSTQALRIFSPPSVSQYVSTQQGFYDTILQLEAMGKDWSAEVVDLPNESFHKDNTHRNYPTATKEKYKG